jgi:hypothetical protein
MNIPLPRAALEQAMSEVEQLLQKRFIPQGA